MKAGSDKCLGSVMLRYYLFVNLLFRHLSLMFDVKHHKTVFIAELADTFNISSQQSSREVRVFSWLIITAGLCVCSVNLSKYIFKIVSHWPWQWPGTVEQWWHYCVVMIQTRDHTWHWHDHDHNIVISASAQHPSPYTTIYKLYTISHH